MPTNVLMPALGMAQETGKLLQWLKAEGEYVEKGELIMQIETDKVTVEIESPASGILANVTAAPGAEVRVGQPIAQILARGEPASTPKPVTQPAAPASQKGESANKITLPVSPVAARIAAEHHVDLAQIKPRGNRIEKADVMAYLTPKSETEDGRRTTEDGLVPPSSALDPAGLSGSVFRPLSSVAFGVRPLASPKARRLAAERGIELTTLRGSGPAGAILAADVPAAAPSSRSFVASPEPPARHNGEVEAASVSTLWRVMAERVTSSWTGTPHFYLVREVMASALVEMRTKLVPVVENKHRVKLTYTDLLVKLIGVTLPDHPHLNAAWSEAGIVWNQKVNIGIATAVEQGLIVPVVQSADKSSLAEIAVQRRDLVERAQQRKLRPADIAGATFTLSNLGMYNVDAFLAIVNTPQAAILAVGRIADRVVPVNGQAVVRPMLTLSLSCDHRLVDGARAAQFIDDLSNLIENPWRLLS